MSYVRGDKHALIEERLHVLLYLRRGRMTLETLKDDLAARCGTKQRVEKAVYWLRRHGLIDDVDTTPHGSLGRPVIVYELSADGRERAAQEQAGHSVSARPRAAIAPRT